MADLDRASPLLKQRVRLRGRVLYCADEKQRIAFEVRAIGEYEDTKPLRELRRRELLAHIRQGTFGYPVAPAGVAHVRPG